MRGSGLGSIGESMKRDEGEHPGLVHFAICGQLLWMDVLRNESAGPVVVQQHLCAQTGASIEHEMSDRYGLSYLLNCRAICDSLLT